MTMPAPRVARWPWTPSALVGLDPKIVEIVVRKQIEELAAANIPCPYPPTRV